MAPARAERPHLPRLVPIFSYGNGGFRFGEMSHRGSILCLPSGIYTWEIAEGQPIDAAALEGAMEEAEAIELLLIGTGREAVPLPTELTWQLADWRLKVDVMPTGAAARTFNILLAERRRVAAALVAVG